LVNAARPISSDSESWLPLTDAALPLVDERVIGADGTGFLETKRQDKI